MTQTPLSAVICIDCPSLSCFLFSCWTFYFEVISDTWHIQRNSYPDFPNVTILSQCFVIFPPHLQTFVSKLQSDVLLSHSTLATLCVLDDALLRWTMFELAWGQPFPWDVTASCLTTSSKVIQMLLSSHSHIPCRQLGNELLPLRWGLWEILWECTWQVLITFELTRNSVLPSPSWGTENYETVSAP